MNAQKFLNELRHRESSDSPPAVTLRALVPSRYVSKLYNHTDKGYINQLMSQFNVKLYALPGGTLQLFFVSGSPRAISNAWGYLFNYFLTQFPLTYGETMGMSFLVPDKLAFLLQNSNINNNHLQSIAKRSKTEIRLKKSAIPNTTEHLLRISVPPLTEDDVSKSFMKAVYLLAQNFQQHITVAYSSFNVYYQPNERQPEYIQDDEGEIIYAPKRDVVPGKWNNDFLK